MEVAVVSEKSFKIKTKNASFVVNPDKKNDGDVVLLTSKPESYDAYLDKIVFDGPGEYEVAGISIKGEKNGEGVAFDLLEENQRLLVLAGIDTEKSKDTEDYTATVVIANDDMDVSTFETIATGVVIVVGNKVPGEHENIQKIDKVNLKKIEDYKGSIVHLVKN